MQKPTKLYRYDSERTISTGIDLSGDFEYCDYSAFVYCKQYNVVKYTKCGVWIISEYGYMKRFVNLNCRKKYACVTKEEALKSFIKRKERQLSILKDQLIYTKMQLKKAINMESKQELKT